MKTKKRGLLVFQFSTLANSAMSVPILRALFDAQPDLEITWVTQPDAVPLFNEFDKIKLIEVDLNGTHQGWKGMYRLFQGLRQASRYRAIVDLQGSQTTLFLGVLFQAIGYRLVRVNWGYREKARLIRCKNKILIPLTHTVFRFAAVFQKLGFTVPLEGLETPPKPIYNQANILNEDPPKKWIGVAPFANNKTNTYPLNKMQQVIAFLQQSHKVYLFGITPEEIEQLRVWEKAYPNVVNVSDKMSFEEQLNLIPHLDLMLSMDSQFTHFAANWKVPVLTIWGQTHPYGGFAPFGQPIANAILPDLKQFPSLPQSIDGNKKGAQMEAIFKSITPKLILEKALELMGYTSS